jgi:hypothetical protein
VTPEFLMKAGETIVYLVLGAAALLGSQRGIQKLKSHRNGNGGGHETSPSTIKLLALETRWREKVDRAVDQVPLQGQRLETLEDLAGTITRQLQEISAQIADVRVEVAEQGKCCEHCK